MSPRSATEGKKFYCVTKNCNFNIFVHDAGRVIKFGVSHQACRPRVWDP